MPYDVFLSYSQAVDGQLAGQVQSLLGSLAKPWHVRRALHVFRDKTSLSTSPSLWSAIEAALDESRNFVLLASPAAASSTWVAKEVEHWLTRRGVDRLHIVLTSGRIVWDAATADFAWGQTDALPRCLAKRFAEEPLYIDLAWAHEWADVAPVNPRFRSSVAALAGAIRGVPPDEILSEDLRQHRRRLRIAWGVAGAIGALAIAAGAASILAVKQRNEAVRQERISRSQRLAAEAVNEMDRQRELAALLAIEARAVAPTAEAWRALTHVVGQSHRLVSVVDRAGAAGATMGACCAVFSADGRWLAWWRGSSVVGMRLNPDAAPKVWLTATPEPHRHIAFDPSGKQIVAAWAGYVAFWEPERETLSQTRELDPRAYVAALRFAPIGSDSSALAVGMSNTRLLVSTSMDRNDFRVLRGHLGPVEHLAFSADGRLLASADAGVRPRVLVWDIVAGAQARTVLVRDQMIRGVAFSADRLVVAEGGGQLTLWDVRRLPTPALLHGQSTGSDVTVLAQAPFGGLATGHADGSVRLWTVRSSVRTTLERVDRDAGGIGRLPGPVRFLEFSASGHLLAAAGGGVVRTFDVAVGKPFGPDLSISRADHAGLALSSSGARLALIDAEGTVATYRSGRGADVRGDIACFPHGKTYAGPAGRMVLEIDSSTGQPTGRPLTGPRLLVDQVAISDDGRWIAASSIGEGTLLWSNREAPRESVWVEREEKPPADLFEAMRLFYRGLGFDPTGATLAFARVRHSDPGAKHVWSSSVVEYDVGRKASTVLIADYPALVSDLASSRIDAGTWFAVAWDGTLHVLHADGREAHTRHIGGQPNRVCTLPTDVLVVADDVGQVTFWRDSEVLHRSREHLSAIEALACDREGRWVLTGDQSGSVRIWDAGSHVHLGELFHAGAAVSAIAQAPGSDTAVVLTAGGVALQVPVSQRAQTARACELAEALRFTRPGSEQRLRSVCSVPAPVRHDRTAAAAAYRSASGLLEAGRHDDALAAFRKAAAEHPTHAATRVGIGLALLHLERPAEALDAFDQAERLSGDRAEISLNRGLALRLLGDADAARLALERAIQLNPLIPEPYVQLADVLVAGGRLTEARSICARLEQEPALRRRQPDCLAVLPR